MHPPVPTDLDDVVVRVRRGDPSGFRRLVDQTSAPLVRMVARLVGDASRAEDLVQESYVKAYRAMINGSFDQRAHVRTWLYRIAVNTAIDELRRPRRDRVDAAEPTAADHADARLALHEVAGWMADLPPEQRAALVLSAFEGHSNREIADILGCSEGAVEQRLVRARATLRHKQEVS